MSKCEPLRIKYVHARLCGPWTCTNVYYRGGMHTDMHVDTNKDTSANTHTCRALHSRFHKLGFQASGNFVMVTVTIVATIQLLIAPKVEHLWDSQDALCAGELNFVAVTDVAGSVSWAFTPSPEEPGDLPEYRPWKESNTDHDLQNSGRVIRAVLSVPRGECFLQWHIAGFRARLF